MSSHARPAERGTRTGSWWQRMRRGAPFVGALVTTRLLVGDPVPAGHGAAGDILGYARTVGASALVLGACMVVLVGLDDYARKLSATMTGPRPRWQYLLLAVACGAAAVPTLAFASGRVGEVANVCGTAGLWAAAACLVVLGRSVAFGRGRRVFWRYPPGGVAPGYPAQPASSAAP